MVKKGSILSRLADRLRSGSGVRVGESGRPAGDGKAVESGRARVERVGREIGRDVPSAGFGEPKTTRKMSEREEAMVALGGHFQELAGLLRGVHTRLDDKLGRLAESADAMQQLPALSNQQLEMLRAVAGHVERNNQIGQQLASSLHGLPQMMTSVEQALQRAAQSDERTSATMREFQGTMDRIHTAMGRMVENSEQQTRATQSIAQQRTESIEQLTRAQQQAVDELKGAASTSLESLRRTHEDQSNRLQRVVQEHAGWNKAVLALLCVIGVGIVFLIGLQLFK